MAKHPDVAIIGGGIIGLTCAYFLAREGLAVEVLDRGEFGKEASWAGAGIIPPGDPARAATPIDRLRAVGSARFPGFSEELRELTGIDNGYLACGGIEFLDARDRDAIELWRAEGIAFEALSPAALHECEPAVADAPGEPYLLPGCAQVRNPWHVRALVAACVRVGVALTPHSSVGGLAGLSRSGRAGRYLVAAGAWTDELLAPALRRGPGVHPVRGQIVLLRTPARIIRRVQMCGKRYLVPRADGRVLIGSTEEPEAGFEKANTAEGVAQLLRFATRLVPTLASAELEQCWSGLRPATPDGHPFIGPVPGLGNVFVAAGHFRAGVQLSIGTAQAMAELLTGRSTCVPLEAFALDRAPATAGRPAFRS